MNLDLGLYPARSRLGYFFAMRGNEQQGGSSLRNQLNIIDYGNSVSIPF